MIKRILKKIAHASPFIYAQYIKNIIDKTKSRRIVDKYIEDSEVSKLQIDKYFKNNKMPKLQIGCGTNIMEGWLNTDLCNFNHSTIFFLDASKKFPFEDESFQYIYSEHIFEHLSFSEALNMISECYRVLKPNGYIRIATPDIEFLIKLYENQDLPIHKEYIKWATERFCKNVSENFIESQYLAVYVINNFYRDWGHKLIHNFQSIKQILEKNKFIDVTRQNIGVSNINEFKGIEKHGGIIPEKYNELETVVVEAKK